MKIVRAVAVCASLGFALGCGGGSMGPGSGLTLSLTSSAPQVFQGQASVAVTVNLMRSGSTGNVTLSVMGLPQGATDTIQSPGSGSSGSVSFSAGTAAAGTYPVTITASDGNVSGNANASLTIGVAAVISSTQTQPFSVAMSTAFQPAEWDNQFFTLNPNLNPSVATTLGNLGPHHIRLQGISKGVPQGSEGTSSTAWDFTTLDDIVQPVLGVGDHSPEFQIAKAPAFMYVNSDSSNTFQDLTFAQFAGYAKSLVEYYNTGGFTANGTKYVSKAWPNETVTYWGIYNEPSINNHLTATEYVTMYNALVPAMHSADSSIKFVGLEMCCSSEDWALTFAQNVSATVPVDAVATHYYSSCNQKDTDVMLFDTVPGFAASVQTIHANLSTNARLANVPIWVTENNVNADFDAGNGISACTGQPFVTDLRGSSPFFAAWRPYVFSQLGKVGVPMLYHWDYGADKQFGEVDYATGTIQLSYWVDYWLGQIFPPAAGSQLLSYSATDDAELETLAVQNNDKSVVVMVANRTVNSPSDNNGPGSPRTVLVDVSSLGTFSSASLVTIDKDTSVSSGPTPTSVTPSGQMIITLNGYSVAFLTLKP